MTDRRTARQEPAQRAADAYIELAQVLERAAKDYRQRAKHYRAGELLTGYTNLPADAGDHVRHPCQRAIDTMSPYDLIAAFGRLRNELSAPIPVHKRTS